MMDKAADNQATRDDATTDEKEGRERSTIGFPYVPLEDAIDVAEAIQQKVGSGLINDDQLAPALDLSQKSSGYRTKLSAARLFGLIESIDGGHKLAELGKRVVDTRQARAARAEAFLRIPLYNRVYEEHKGGTVPPAAALEREFVSFGVAAKQTSRARQVLERSAEQSGFFEVGRDRLVRPTIKEGDSQTLNREEGDKGSEGSGGGGEGGDGGDKGDRLDPLFEALVKRLPPPGSSWNVAQRANWLRAAITILDLVYEDAGGEIGLTIEKMV